MRSIEGVSGLVNKRVYGLKRSILFLIAVVICGMAGCGSQVAKVKEIGEVEEMEEKINADFTVNIDRKKVEGVSNFNTGITLTHQTFTRGDNPAAKARGIDYVADSSKYVNVHIMGWGVDNINPAPGDYRWESLDSRVELIRNMKATPVITLCAAPDWMKGGKEGTTDWSRIEAAVLPEHFDDFANLAKEVAKRYPDVKNFQVWNEFKGFWSSSMNNWDYVKYTEMYNKVYDALKSVSSDIKVGGFYLVIEGTGSEKTGNATGKPITDRNMKVLDYWLKNKKGADFICLDKGLNSYHDPNSYTDEELLNLTHYFGDVASQVRAKTDLPIWWSEFYGGGNTNSGVKSGSDDVDFMTAEYSSIMYHMIKAGSTVALLWNPQQGEVQHYLFSKADTKDGANPSPYYYVFKAVNDYFKPGTELYCVTSSSKDIEVIAASDKAIVINKLPKAVTVSVNNKLVELKRYEVCLLDESNKKIDMKNQK